MLTPGQQLRALREELGLSVRDVETATTKIAARQRNAEFTIPSGRLVAIETKDSVPTIHGLYSLAIVYRSDLRELLAWYIDLSEMARDIQVIEPPKSHRAEVLRAATEVHVPVRLDPGFDTRSTMNLSRMIQQWGTLPLAYLPELLNTGYTYGYVGTEDYAMYPIVPPGSFLQIDESRREVVNGIWRTEHERPIYFVGTRDGYTCSWCTLKHGRLILQSHPLSPAPVRIMQHPGEAEVIGQVVGIAMKVGHWRPQSAALDSGKDPEMRVPELGAG